MSTDFNRLKKSLGPGILFASTAIGVSHLMQSTRAGAVYGIALLGSVILANLLKYPFFEFGTRYAASTGRSIIDGYKNMGWWMLGLYAIVTFFTMWLVVAAVTAVTAAFLDNLFALSQTFGNGIKAYLPYALLLVCGLILANGRFSVLDKLIKVIGATLLISTLVAFVMSMRTLEPQLFDSYDSWDISNAGDVAFLIALVGWMPTAVDLSAWNSLWTIEKLKTHKDLKMRELLIEFRIGYWISALLALCFILMGAVFFYGKDIVLLVGGAAFANQVVSIYTSNFGTWSYTIIAASTFSIMFGTCLAVIDGYVRSTKRVLKLTIGDVAKRKSLHKLLLIGLCLGSAVLVHYFGDNTRQLVDLATTASFIIAPVIAIANVYLISTLKKERHRPGKLLMFTSYIGILALIALLIVYLWV